MSRDGKDQSKTPVTQPATEPTTPPTTPVTPPTEPATPPETPPETGMSPGSGEGKETPIPTVKIQSIELTESSDVAGSNYAEAKLVIKSEGEIQFNVSLLNGPDRVVIDLQNSDVNNIKDFVPTSALVSNVRVAQYTLSPMVVRIVLDLNKIVSYTPKVDESGKELTLTLSEPSIKGKVIVIDAGHGGYDPGALGVTGLYEKDFNLDTSLKLQDKLTALGATVIMTRTDDSFISLSGRANVANQVYADIFVSVHANSTNSSALRGTSTYFYAPSTNPALYSQREQRQKLAARVQNRLAAELGTRNIGTLQANFAVLRETQMPSILVESAFLSNPDDEALLKDSQFRDKEAQAIADGLSDYFAN
jgi:N-acetylmuramoyl-L-alanine amidase